MERYAAAKRRIVERQDPSCDAVVNVSDPWIRAFAEATPARVRGFSRSDPSAPYTVAPRQGEPWFVERLDGAETAIAPVSSLRIPGAFHADNALAAIAAARAFGLDASAVAPALATFRGVDHRFQPLTPVDGVKIYDNAVSTVPESTASALEALPEGALWIAGGKSKGLDLSALARLAAVRRARAFLYGESRSELGAALEGAGVPSSRHTTLRAAFEAARVAARPGDALLYSPAFPSFDQYRNFQERGAEFRSLVERWRGDVAGPALEAAEAPARR
jgi:UDP-N-acetylmuramoylalanine--D-glutamate ligase